MDNPIGKVQNQTSPGDSGGETVDVGAKGRVRGPNPASEKKYAYALRRLENDAEVKLEDVAYELGLNVNSFRSFVRTWHPGLLRSRRHGATAAKYAEAIAAMRSRPGSDVAEVAALYGHAPEALRCYLRRHAPELILNSGVSASGHSARRRSAERYHAAIVFYACGTHSLAKVAERYGIVYNSLYDYVRRHHPDLLGRARAKSAASGGGKREAEGGAGRASEK